MFLSVEEAVLGQSQRVPDGECAAGLRLQNGADDNTVCDSCVSVLRP